MTSYERIERVIYYIESHRLEQPRLATLAKIAGLSEFHFHRLFSRWAGTTPKVFLKYITNRHAKELLMKSHDLLSVSLDSGLSGPGRLHDLLVTVDGVTPGEFKSRGAGLEVRYGFHETPFGTALLGLTQRGVCHLTFLVGQRAAALRELKRHWPKARILADSRSTGQAAEKIFGLRRNGRTPVFLTGSPFQIKVWEALLRIPRGKTASYGDIARVIGRPHASRAVGSAVGKNSVGFLIPCHRVIRNSGIIGDYRWGSRRKRAILAWEGIKSNLA